MPDITSLNLDNAVAYCLYVTLRTEAVQEWHKAHPEMEHIDVVIVIDGQRREMSLKEFKQLLFP